jgi:hypothetical protein
MLTRGPRKRRLGFTALPDVMRETFARTRAQLAAMESEQDLAPRIEKLLADLDRLEEEYTKTTPEFISDQIKSPWPTIRVAATVHRMAWHVLGVPHAVTSDTPLAYSPELRLNHPQSYFVFAIDPHRVIVGDYGGEPGATYYGKVATPRVAKQLNRRIIAMAEQFVFADRNVSWVETVVRRWG